MISFRSMHIWLDIFDPLNHYYFTGAFCHVTPVLNDILDLCRYNLAYLTPPTKISWVQFVTLHPVLNYILELCRFDLDVLEHPLLAKMFTGCFLSDYTTAIQPISIQLLQTQQKPRVTEVQHNAEKHFLLRNSNILSVWSNNVTVYPKVTKLMSWQKCRFRFSWVSCTK